MSEQPLSILSIKESPNENEEEISLTINFFGEYLHTVYAVKNPLNYDPADLHQRIQNGELLQEMLLTLIQFLGECECIPNFDHKGMLKPSHD